MTPGAATLLCLYLNASFRWKGRPLYRLVVETARSLHLAGASVFPVDLSYGEHRRLRDSQSEYQQADLPVILNLVDAPDRIDALLAALGESITDGLVTVEPAIVVSYTHHEDEENRAGWGMSSTSDAAAMVSQTTQPPHAGEPPMPLEGDAQRVTVYIGSSDTWRGHNLASAIVEHCRKHGIAGATTSLGVLGFGKHSRIHRAHLFGLSQDLPEKVEIIDRPERIAQLLPTLNDMVDGGLIIVQDVKAIRYSHHSDAS
jgi:PII-like signaling protein